MRRIVYDSADISLRPDERLDDLCCHGMRLVQRQGGYCFTSDAVALTDFISGGVKDRALEFGTGTGVIALLAAKKYGMRVDAVEIQEVLSDQAARSVALNGLNDKVKVYHGRIQDAADLKTEYDVVFCNPPYFKQNAGKHSKTDEIDTARRETAVTFQEITDAAVRCLKFGGRFFTVNTAERLAEVMTLCKTRGLEPKILQFLTPKTGEAPHLFLLKCVSGGHEGIKVLPSKVVDIRV